MFPYLEALLRDQSRMFNLAQKIVDRANDGEDMQRLFRHLPKDMQYLVADICEAAEDRMMLYAIYKVEVLDYKPQRLNNLRAFIQKFSNAMDEDEVIEYLESRWDLVYCENCDEWEFSDYSTSTREYSNVCRSCIEEDYSWSDYYDEYVRSTNFRWALDEEGDEVGIDCDDDDFYFNDDLDRYVHRDYEHEEPVIASYHSSKGSFRKKFDDWVHKHNRFFGVELEVEARGREPKDLATHINNLVNGGEVGSKLFFERDGSVSNGFEMITHPMSLPAQRELWSFLKDADNVKGMRSHNTSSCGLHVHVSKSGMTKLQIAKLVTFVNNPENESFIRAVARRYAEGYCKIKNKTIGQSHYSTDRYEAINITGYETVEFRIFKGSLKYESVIAALEFTNALVEYTKTCNSSVNELHHEKFMEFCVKKLPKETATLRAYAAARLELA